MPSETKKLTKNFIYNLVTQIFVVAIPLITTPYLARVFHEEGTGQLSYSSSIIAYFILLANLGFAIYGQREIAKTRDDIEKKSATFFEILFLRFIFTVLSLAILFSILFTVGFGEKYDYLIKILSITVAACFFDLTFYFQGIEDFKTIAIRSILIKVVGLVLIFTLVKTVDDLWIYALFTSLTTIASYLLMWPKAVKSLKFVKISIRSALKRFWPSFLIFLPTLAVTIYTVFDKTMIGLLSSNPDYDNGCYEKAYQINNMALMVVVVLSPVMIPRNAYCYAQNDTESLRKNMYFSSNYVWITALPLIAGFIALSNNLSAWFLGDGYTEVPVLLMIMSVRLLTSGLGCLFGDQYFLIIGKEKYYTVTTIIAALVNFGLNFLFISNMGAIGAAITTSITEFLVFLLLLLFIIKDKTISIKIIFAQSIKYIIASGIMFVGLFFLQKLFGYSIWTFLLLMLIGIVIYGVVLLLLRDKFVYRILGTIINALKRKKTE